MTGEKGMKAVRVRREDALWEQLIQFAENCSWVAGRHLAGMMRENRYWPWISSVFVDERYRGRRISHLLIGEAIRYAEKCGFEKVYIPSDMTGFYEKCGFRKIDELVNYAGDADSIFMRETHG